ncbi:MAG: hypothetical protein P4L53_12580 [Candidatus Obscuribacterales bacterium]|nr:hypothetical protein [Candidatus Obscuribacterales bacterium]
MFDPGGDNSCSNYPIAEAAEMRKIPRLVTVLALYLAAAMTYGALAALLVPAIHEQWHKLNDNLPGYLSGLSSWYKSTVGANNTSANVLTFMWAHL